MQSYKSKPRLVGEDPSDEFPYQYQEVTELGGRSNREMLMEYLGSQKEDYKHYLRQKRQFLNKYKKDELFKQRQSMSNGYPKHQSEFKPAVKAEEVFEKEKPILRFPQDHVLNTFDNTKQFLKEIEFPKEERLMHSMDLKANKFRHYKGDPWHYVSKDAQYLNKFVCYPNMPDLVIDKKKVYAEKGKYLVPVSSHPNLFSPTQADEVHVRIPLDPIHTVKYYPDEVKVTTTGKTSKLTSLQLAKPFVPPQNYGKFFERKSIQLRPIESLPTLKTSITETQSTKRNGQSFIRNGSPPRSSNHHGTSRTTSPN